MFPKELIRRCQNERTTVQHFSRHSGCDRAGKTREVGIILAAHHPTGIPLQKVTPAEQQAYEQLQSILSEIPQWSDEEDLRSDMEEIGGRVWYCHYWEEHYSMVELTEDLNGKFNVDYVLDDAVTPEVRREAALLAQKELAECIQAWDIALLDTSVPEQMKYASLTEAASHLMQILNDPESITG